MFLSLAKTVDYNVPILFRLGTKKTRLLKSRLARGVVRDIELSLLESASNNTLVGFIKYRPRFSPGLLATMTF